jgi:hypothetical protein
VCPNLREVVLAEGGLQSFRERQRTGSATQCTITMLLQDGSGGRAAHGFTAQDPGDRDPRVPVDGTRLVLLLYVLVG